MTNRNKPRVSNDTGKVKITNTGRRTVLKRPITKVAIKAAEKLVTFTPS